MVKCNKSGIYTAYRFDLFKNLRRRVNGLCCVNGCATFEHRDIFMEFIEA